MLFSFCQVVLEENDHKKLSGRPEVNPSIHPPPPPTTTTTTTTHHYDHHPPAASSPLLSTSSFSS